MLSKLLNGHDEKRNVTIESAVPAAWPDNVLSGIESFVTEAATGVVLTSPPDPEMVKRATRRRHTIDYKLSILSQADACRDRGEVGALLRREGLFYSTLANFRKQKAQGLLAVGDGAVRPRASKDPAVAAALAGQAEMERELRSLRRKLAHAEKIIAIQKKAAILLGETLQDMNLDEMD
jgi:transposase-like protein